jgi:hypothetical protein
LVSISWSGGRLSLGRFLQLRAIPRGVGHNHSEDHPLAPLVERPVCSAWHREVKADVGCPGSPGAAEEGQRRGPNAHVLERAQALHPTIC